MTPEAPRRALCPDWRERETFVSGPGELLDALEAHWEAHGDPDRFHLERFQPKLMEAEGDGGTIVFLKSDCEVEADGTKPILVVGEEAGLELPYGCREGICHTCVGTLRSGRSARPAQREGLTAATARPSAPASTRPRGASRSSCRRESDGQSAAPADRRADRGARA